MNDTIGWPPPIALVQSVLLAGFTGVKVTMEQPDKSDNHDVHGNLYDKVNSSVR